MLSWVLRRGADGSAGKHQDGETDDTTFIEQPDTPAPVFAARAFKSAIFGTPGQSNVPSGDSDEMAIHAADGVSTTPQKPQGILLTPGTGTSRPKRVSFDHLAVDKPEDTKRSKKTKFTGRSNDKLGIFAPKTSSDPNKRTRLTETTARGSKETDGSTNKSKDALAASKVDTATEVDDFEDDDWEEEGNDDNCMHDITLDLNEPHSRSGKYWKLEFEQYHQDARVEMEKLLKYKQLAKSYAKMKDAEAIDLGGKLKEEQDKVVKMEKQITEMAAQIASKRARGEDGENPQLMKDLAKQTALAVQYRSQVKDLEALVHESQGDGDDEGVGTKNRRTRQSSSPRTQKALLETQRELRRARSQIKENGDLKEQIKQLQSKLRAAEKEVSKLTDENKKLAGQNTQPNRRSQSGDSEVRQKDDELRRLTEEFDRFKMEASQREDEMQGVLEKANCKMSELKREIRTLKTSSVGAAGDAKPAPVKFVDPVPTLRRSADHHSKRHSIEDPAKEKEKDNEMEKGGYDLLALGKKLNDGVESRSLRAKFREDGGLEPLEAEGCEKPPVGNPKSTPKENGPKDPVIVFEDPADSDKPRWMPFIPRSPRNRNYLGNDLNEMIQKSGAIPTGATPAPPQRYFLPPTPLLDGPRPIVTEVGGPKEASPLGEKVDVERMKANLAESYERFNREALGKITGKESNLPPERRAAAIARIERRKAERKRRQEPQSQAPVNINKENLKP